MKSITDVRALALLLLVAIFVATSIPAAYAGGCCHHGPPGPPGEQGPPGPQGEQGQPGQDGRDGEVPIEWFQQINHWNTEIREAAAAMTALNAPPPFEQQFRITGNVSHVHGKTGYGVGYSRRFTNDAIASLAVGHSGSETAVQGSFGFEFGGSRDKRLSAADISLGVSPSEPVSYEPPPGQVLVPDDEYATLLLAQASQEDVEDHLEQSEYRYIQQQEALDRLSKEDQEKAKEVERLKLEAAALRAEKEREKERRANARLKLKDKADGPKDDHQ